MYAPLLFFSVLSLWLFSRFFYRGKNIWILTIVNVLLVYTHYFGWFVIFGQIAAILIFQRIKIRHVAIMFAIALAAYVPWIWAVARATSDGAEITQNIGWMERPGIFSFAEFCLALVEPVYAQMSSIQPRSIYALTIPMLLLIGAAKIHYFAGWSKREDKSSVAFLAVASAVPVILVFIVSWIMPVSIWGTRHLIIVFAPIMLLMGIFIAKVRPAPVRYAAIGGICVLAVLALVRQEIVGQPEFVWCGWKGSSDNITANGGGNIYAVEDLIAYQLWFDTRSDDGVKIFKAQNVPGVNEDPAYFLPRGFDDVEKVASDTINDEKIWLAFRGQGAETSQPPLNYFISRGYTVGNFYETPADGERAFLVEMIRTENK